MSKGLVNKAGQIGQDNLIAKPFPRALTFGIRIAAGQGELKRGTVLVMNDGGEYAILDNETTGKANCILADPVDASGNNAVTAVAYRTGHFNTRALITGEDYTMTAADREELRRGGILLSEMLD